METVGVELVVSGLKSFLGDMSKADKSITSLIPGSDLLKRAFSGLGNVVEWLTGSVFRILEYTLGSLLADAIQGVLRWVRELGAGILESADTFQKLEIRLQRLNFNDARDSGLEYNDAMKEAIRLTKEQLDWTIRLGAKTPFDAKDVANIFTLAKGYGFTNDEATGLTESVIDFTAGMGLSNTELERIIVNFGQLRQQGKLNNQDLRDLARGAFVPINKIIEITAEKLGITVDEFNKLKKSGKLSADAVDLFRQSFQELVGTDFEGASQALGNVFSVARQNVEGLIRDTLGLYVVSPILMTIGTHVQELTDTITDNDERWNLLVDSLNRIGTAAVNIVSRILGLGGSAEETADKFLGAVEDIATWLETNQDRIVGWAADLRDWIMEKAIPAILTLKDKLFGAEGKPGAIQKFGDWLMNDLVPFIKRQVLPVLSDLNDMIFGGGKEVGVTLSPDKQGGQFVDDLSTSISEINNTPLQNLLQIFKDLAPAVEPLLGLLGALGDVIIVAFGGDQTQTFGEFVRDTLVPALIDLKKWVDQNKEGLALLLKAFIAMEIIGGVIGLITALIVKVVAFLAAVGALVLIGGYISYVVDVIRMFVSIILWWRDTFAAVINYIIGRGNDLRINISNIFNAVMDAIKNKDWLGVGKALVSGIWTGIQSDWYRVINLAKELGQAALNAFKSVFKIKSPSGEMWDIGENVVLGLAKGISDSTKFAVGAMTQMAAMTMAPPAKMASQLAPTSVNNTTNNYFQQTVNTSARSEPIIQDFQMMQSLAGF